ncbi:hypothetical protein PSTU1396_01515 [Providencia stuartii]|nr:hypothetical protein DR96_1400 [Providencia stuartii]CAK6601014.1 hypothetical protein PSTU1396_01515 [Providencia stuartii]CAK6603016.1 hypothetical protein PS9952019_01515 [Providencia stuartii]SUC44003.1 Uncharacterised protein [Providencia stuartii]SUC44830.1 Uncharacterised protein [Providencia stuartii]
MLKSCRFVKLGIVLILTKFGYNGSESEQIIRSMFYFTGCL